MLPGVLVLGLGIARLVVARRWQEGGRSAVLGYLAVLLGGVLVLAGLPL